MKRNSLIFVLLLVLLLLGTCFISYIFILPRYIENRMLPELGQKLSGNLTGTVYNLGFSAADFGDIVFGDSRKPALSIDSIHADYSVTSLLANNLGQIRINGLKLYLEVVDGRIILPGIDLEKTKKQGNVSNFVVKPSEINLPAAIGELQINSSLLQINIEGRRLLVPFDVKLNRRTRADIPPVYEFTIRLMVQSEEVTVKGTIDLADSKTYLTLVADSLDLSRFSFLFGDNNHAFNPGNASIRGEAEVFLLPFQLLNASVEIVPDYMRLGDITVRFGQTAPDAGPAIMLKLKSEQEQLLFSAQGLTLEPFVGSFESEGAVLQKDEILQGNGYFRTTIAGSPAGAERAQPLKLESFPDLYGSFAFVLDKTGTWTAELNSSVPKQKKGPVRSLGLRYDSIGFSAGSPSFSLHGQGNGTEGKVLASLALPDVQAGYGDAHVRIPLANLQASYSLKEGTDVGRISGGAVSLELNRIIFQEKDLYAEADMVLQAEMMPQSPGGDKGLQAAGNVTLAKAVIKDRSSGVVLGAIAGNIPWFWPRTGEEAAGELNIAKIEWRNLDLGTFASVIELKKMQYSLEGAYSSSLLKGIVTKVSGKAGNIDAGYFGELAVHSAVKPFPAVNLGIFNPKLEKSYFAGEFGMDGAIRLDAGRLQGKIEVKLRNGTYEFPEKKYRVRGIDLNMRMPALPNLHTAPAQTLHFAEAAIGDLAFSNGRLIWQLESMTSVFLEEGVVHWAGGRVFTNAVRISPESEEIILPIFCDRLLLSGLLQQFGVRDAQGEGTVNGRIPLRIGKKTVRFDDGFLYSSPGQGGSIKVAAFDMLSAGIPKNTPQFAQVDFAAEALKNFQYNWVKLLLNSEGEDLVMEMQMDGKPLQALPFKYDSRTGLLQRDENKGPGLNQPIRLDVNFRLPLDRFLGYSGRIQDIMEKIK